MAFAAAEAAPTAAAEAEAAGSTFASASNVAEVMAAAAAAAAVFVVTDANPSLERRVVDLAECGVCVGLLFEPTTAPCGHSFCRQCLLRSLRHSPRCPTCRAYVGGGGAHAVNYALRQLVQQLAPQAYAARGAEAAAEPPVELEELGLFALEPLLPRQAMALFVFEPRYRRLVQACLGGSRRFGMMAPLGGNAVTEVEVTETTQLEGGRYLIQIVGRRRMNILRSWTSDHGYRVAAVEPLFDEPLAAADAGADAARSAAQQFSELAQQLDGEVALWCARVRLRRGRAQQVDALLAQLGDMPRDNPEDLGLWLAALINPLPALGVAPEVRHFALEETSSLVRLNYVRGALLESLEYVDPEATTNAIAMRLEAWFFAVTRLVGVIAARLLAPFLGKIHLPLEGYGQ